MLTVLTQSLSCSDDASNLLKVDLSSTTPIVWGMTIDDQYIHKQLFKGESKVESLAHINLKFINLPASEEGNHYTLIGGGLAQRGLHGPISTKFEGLGYYFAAPEKITNAKLYRDVSYKDDYTREVRDGMIEFDIYYEPSNINVLDERYFPGTEIALSMMRTGTSDRVLHATDHEFNWSIAGIGKGNSAAITIDMAKAEYTWYLKL
ncbi:MAG: hypothetical protein WD267_00370 [Balneolales bacterium]